jgi:methionyl-tRNA formyltransferase
MRVAFFGTPEFAVPTLNAVAAEHEIVVVVAQPDRPAGRGMKLHVPPVAERARELGIPVMQPLKIREQAFLDAIAAHRPDVGVVIAYGRILPKTLLEIPTHGFVNVHGSVLPKYRGAAPIQRAIAAGESTLGVSIMRVDEELDHGPVFKIATLEAGEDERAPSIMKRLAELGGGALASVLYELARGTAEETPQQHELATIAPKLEKSEAEIRWSDDASAIYNRFRAFDPWPGAFFHAHGEAIKVPEMRRSSHSGTSGTILELTNHNVIVATGREAIELIELQRPGKSRTAAAEVARSLGWSVGATIS